MKQIILIRKDLKMRRGKEVAQGSHASMVFLLKNYANMSTKLLMTLSDWVKGGQTKVCLQVHSEKELVKLYKEALKADLETHIITDAGRTEFDGVPTKTCVAIGPNKSEEIDKITGHLKLY